MPSMFTISKLARDPARQGLAHGPWRVPEGRRLSTRPPCEGPFLMKERANSATVISPRPNKLDLVFF